MSGPGKASGLTAEERAELLERLSRRRDQRATAESAPHPGADCAPPSPAEPARIADELAGFELFRDMQIIRSAGAALGIPDPYFRAHDGVAGAETVIAGRRYLNFSSYNYLGLNGHPAIDAAAKAAIDRYGTSASASRLVSGERPVHRALEHGLAEILGAEDCVAMVSGHATNVTVIGHLLGAGDLVLHDSLIHNSVLQGALLSGARRLGFSHNDAAAAERVLAEQRRRHRRALLVIEGHYSMDGDVPDLPAFIAMARRHNAWLLVDEAHALGVLGPRGFGVADHFGIDPAGVDLWMGTLSKTLAGCGGFIAGRAKLVEYLKFSAPGFVYSVGLSPPVAAAALAALELMRAEPERVRTLNANARACLEGARARGFDVGLSAGHAIVPVITASSIVAARLSDALFRRGVNVQPILYPAVPERAARLRFFLSCEHTPEQIERALDILAEERDRIAGDRVDLAALAHQLGLQGKREG